MPLYRSRAVVADVSDIARRRLSTSGDVFYQTPSIVPANSSEINVAPHPVYYNTPQQPTFTHTPAHAPTLPYSPVPGPHFIRQTNVPPFSPQHPTPFQVHRQPAFNPRAARPQSNLRHSDSVEGPYQHTFSTAPFAEQNPVPMSPFQVPLMPGPFLQSPVPQQFHVAPSPNTSSQQQPVRLHWMAPNFVTRSTPASANSWYIPQ